MQWIILIAIILLFFWRAVVALAGVLIFIWCVAATIVGSVVMLKWIWKKSSKYFAKFNSF